MSLLSLSLLVLAAAGGGAINAIGGGGTLLTFPSLIAAGVPAVTANATSTFSLVPGALASVYGYRRHFGAGGGRVLLALAVPSLVGGYLGARLAVVASDRFFGQLVPWLILGATALFALQEALRQRSMQRLKEPRPPRLWLLAALQLPVAFYGGFFGAGLGILLLALLGLAGDTDLHRMNGHKSLVGGTVNAVGTLTFIASGRIDWSLALPMAAGAIAGGLLGARLAQRIGPARVRVAVVAIGLASFALTLTRQLGWVG